MDFLTSDLLTLAAWTDILRGVVLVLFVLSALLVLLVVLAQEGKGGGLSGAFGGAGAETFGVKAGTVNAFTSWIAVAFLGLALVYAGLSSVGKDRERASGVSTEQFTGDTEATDASGTESGAAGAEAAGTAGDASGGSEAGSGTATNGGEGTGTGDDGGGTNGGDEDR